MQTKSILIAGVGGQGIVMASNILAKASMYSGYDVKKSEIHGMAQRGGSVVSHVRYGDRVYSPIIYSNNADIVVSFEKIEFLRYKDLYKKSTIYIVNQKLINPPMQQTGGLSEILHLYDQTIQSLQYIYEVKAEASADIVGNKRVMGIVLLGYLSKFLNIKLNAWLDAMNESIKPSLLNINIEAFRLGTRL